MFELHYRSLLLLSGPLSALQAAVPRMTLMDGQSAAGTDSLAGGN